MQRTIKMAALATATLVIGGHFDAGYIKRDGTAFRFEAVRGGGSA